MDKIQAFNFSVDLLRALLWQYNDAVNLQSILRQKSEWYSRNHTEFWNRWVADVFNLRTANDFGLAVWAIILDMPLTVGIPGSGARPVFGFGQHNQNFTNGNFGRDSAGVAGLTTEQRRVVLLLRYYQLITDGTVPHVNSILKDVFGQGYVLDHLDMTCSYIFPQSLSSTMIQVLENFDLLPRPAGVEVNILINPDEVFGFAPIYLNFENGQFGA